MGKGFKLSTKASKHMQSGKASSHQKVSIKITIIYTTHATERQTLKTLILANSK